MLERGVVWGWGGMGMEGRRGDDGDVGWMLFWRGADCVEMLGGRWDGSCDIRCWVLDAGIKVLKLC